MKIKVNFKYLIIASLPFFLYGCGETTVTPTPTPSASTSQVVLHWWGVFDSTSDVQPLITKYLAQNPNVKDIQYVQKPINGDSGLENYVKTIDTAIADKDQTPDIFMIQNTWAGKYKSLVSLAPSSLIDATYLANYYSVVKSDFYTTNGTIALPQWMDALAIIYNQSELQAAGYSAPAIQWSDFALQAAKLTVKNNGTITRGGFAAGFYTNVQFRFDLINLLMAVNGVSMTNPGNTQATFYSPANKDETDSAVKFFSDLGQSSWSKNMKLDVAAFLEGNLAMFAAPSWRLLDILNYQKQYSLNLSIGVAQVPQLSNYSAYWPTYWAYTVSKTSPNATEAWKFIKFLDQEENLTLYDQTVKQNGRPIGIIFPLKSMNTNLANDNYLGPYVKELDNAQSWYMFDGLKMKRTFETFLGTPENLNNIQGLQDQATSIMQGQ